MVEGNKNMFSNAEIKKIAMAQSSIDLNCRAEDFLKDENVIVKASLSEKAKKFYQAPIGCNFVSYGNNIVASVMEEYRESVEAYLKKYEFYHCFETPNIHWLDERITKLGQKVCFMAEYYLPDIEQIKRLPCGYTLKVLEQKDFVSLYRPEWGNALCETRKELDMIGVGAYEQGKLIGLAGASADCEMMWQIGVDVLPEYRMQGVASALTSHLTMEILERGKVPFYCSAWANIRSARNAIKCGFMPAWAEMTVKPIERVEELNKN